MIICCFLDYQLTQPLRSFVLCGISIATALLRSMISIYTKWYRYIRKQSYTLVNDCALDWNRRRGGVSILFSLVWNHIYKVQSFHWQTALILHIMSAILRWLIRQYYLWIVLSFIFRFGRAHSPSHTYVYITQSVARAADLLYVRRAIANRT